MATKTKERNETLQALCRDYLGRLRYMAKKHGLKSWIESTIRANKRGECEATKKEVNLLSRCVNEERISRIDIPNILGKSYRQCVDDNDFDKIKKLPRVGIYGSVSAILLAAKQKKDTKRQIKVI